MTVRCLYPAARLALVLVAAPLPGGRQEIPTGVTYQLLDSALKARIEAPPAGTRARGRARDFARAFARRAWPLRGALLGAGAVVVVLLGWARWRRGVARRGASVRRAVVGTLPPGPHAEGVSRRDHAGSGSPSAPSPAKSAQPVPLPPHVARFLQENARGRGKGGADAAATPRSGRSAGGHAPEPAPQRPPGGLDRWVPRYGAQGEE